MLLEARALVQEAVQVKQSFGERGRIVRIDMHDVVGVDRYGRLAQGRARQSAEDQDQFPCSHLTGSLVVYESGEFESADQHIAVAAYGMRGLSAKPTRFDPVGTQGLERPLRQ